MKANPANPAMRQAPANAGKVDETGNAGKGDAEAPAKPGDRKGQPEDQSGNGAMKPGQDNGAKGQGQAGKGENAGKPAAQGRPAKPAPQLSGEQRTRVTTVFKQVDVRPVRVDFNVRIGIAVPRTVVLRPIPPEVITVVPDYEGFQFFVVPGQIVVVDPVTLDIVAILPL